MHSFFFWKNPAASGGKDKGISFGIMGEIRSPSFYRAPVKRPTTGTGAFPALLRGRAVFCR